MNVLFTRKVKNNFVRLGVRLHPDILASEYDLNRLEEVRARMDSETLEYIEYKKLPFTRRAWLRKLNTAALLASGTIAASAMTVTPMLLNWVGPFPLVVSFAVAWTSVLVGSEATKTVQDYGPVKSVPVFLLFTIPLAFPIVSLLSAYPEHAVKIISLSSCCLFFSMFIAHHGPGFDDNRNMILMPLVAAMMFFGYLIPPVADFSLFGLASVVGSPLFALGTWSVCQRNMKLAKWNDSLDNLNVRFTNALGLVFIFPILLFSFLTACAAYQVNREEKKKLEGSNAE